MCILSLPLSGFLTVNIAKDNEQVEGVTLEKMKLAFEMKDHVVAWGTIFDSDVEGDNVKVTVDVVVDGNCAIPIQSEQGMYKMSQKVGSHILWPRHLIITDNIKITWNRLRSTLTDFLQFRTLVVINLTKKVAFWIDPSKNRIDPDVSKVVERSFNIMKKKKLNWRVVKGLKQSGVVECGYYVMWFMHDIILSTSTSIIHIMKYSSRAYIQDVIDCIRSEWAEFVGKHVHCA
ncbi:uncharacterized protein E6C27_scaffold498G001200 [Cucumis melo var. makuwa]|uniref:DUF8039 domain-containing protein n=1 Tax=Cucumis melo var. makuwa TaxID=1194695 RepID=A0A5A7TZW9_CUCMM|nr:uncharacterized protein E6C27_scaffold498G001200 [Cucumis melo var. makuwa]